MANSPESLHDLQVDAKQALMWHITTGKQEATELPSLAAAAALLEDTAAMDAIVSVARALATGTKARGGQLGTAGVLALARTFQILDRAGEKGIRQDLITGDV